MIELKLLRHYGAVERQLKKGYTIFTEHSKATGYYQIIRGIVKINNYHEGGSESIQLILSIGDGFGGVAILGGYLHTSNAIALEDVTLVYLEKTNFLDLLKEHNDACIKLLTAFSKKLRFKAIIGRNAKRASAEGKIIAFLNLLREKKQRPEQCAVELTRQVIADLTGLRVETVIKVLIKLNQKGQVSIINRKVYI